MKRCASYPVGRTMLVAALAAPVVGGCVLATDFDAFTAGGGDVAVVDASVDGSVVDAAPVCLADASFASDPRSCGRCGHDCLGGECAGGVCQPIELASGIDDLGNIQLAGGALFFTAFDAKRVGSIPVDGGPITDVATTESAYTVAVRGDDVFFGGPGLHRAARAGGGAVDLVADFDIGNVATTADAVFFTDFHQNKANVGALYRRTGFGDIVKLAGGLSSSEALAVRGDTVFYGENGVDGASNGRVWSVPVMGGTPKMLADAAARRLAVDDAFVYFVRYDSGEVRRVPLAGGDVDVVSVSPSVVEAGDIALDATDVYWAVNDDSASGGGIYHAPKTGGVATPLAAGRNDPVGIAVDDRAVYWTETGTAKILKVAK